MQIHEKYQTAPIDKNVIFFVQLLTKQKKLHRHLSTKLKQTFPKKTTTNKMNPPIHRIINYSNERPTFPQSKNIQTPTEPNPPPLMQVPRSTLGTRGVQPPVCFGLVWTTYRSLCGSPGVFVRGRNARARSPHVDSGAPRPSAAFQIKLEEGRGPAAMTFAHVLVM